MVGGPNLRRGVHIRLRIWTGGSKSAVTPAPAGMGFCGKSDMQMFTRSLTHLGVENVRNK